MTQEHQFFDEIVAELTKARAKFPKQSVWVTLAALTEEVGELNQAILQLNFDSSKMMTANDARQEAVQVATMAIRVILDCTLRDC